ENGESDSGEEEAHWQHGEWTDPPTPPFRFADVWKLVAVASLLIVASSGEFWYGIAEAKYQAKKPVHAKMWLAGKPLPPPPHTVTLAKGE
ncbi:MAG: hypothetical protein V4674_01030, partial [Patescibacteria group bacterium]